MSLSAPTPIYVPWATSGQKVTIPAAADNVLGRAGWDLGFPPINLTAKEAGGIPPFGQDMNGLGYAVSQALQWIEAVGGIFPYSSTFATAIAGYPAGALVARSDNSGYWRNTVAGNSTDPEGVSAAGWQPEQAGLTPVTMSNANVTLTALQAGRPIILISGTLTANLNLIFPTWQQQWLVVNAASGAFSVTCKTASGSGVTVATGATAQVYGDGTNIVSSSSSVSFASAAEAQAFASTTKVISPSTLAAALQGANQSLVANGYQKLPGGLILQWGTAYISSSGTLAITFPITFPSSVFPVLISQNGADGNVTVYAKSLTASGFTAGSLNSATATANPSVVGWVALGH